MSLPEHSSDDVNWQARFIALAAACYETRERAACYSEMNLTDFQRTTLMNVLEPMNEQLAFYEEAAQ